MLVLLLLASGCGVVATPTADSGNTPRDTGPARDRGPAVDAPSPTADRDGDGLCDATELARRTDPSREDTDYDGLLDAFEARIGSDPLNANDPSSRDRMQVAERDGSSWPTPWFVEWRGMGEGLLATILDRAGGVDGRLVTEVADFSVAAIGGDPSAFVGGADGARFFGVGGPVRLEWRVTATWRDAQGGEDAGLPRALGCRRAYEAIAIVKQDGGETVAARRLILDVVPAGAGLDGGTAVAWPDGATAEGFCRPSACF